MSQQGTRNEKKTQVISLVWFLSLFSILEEAAVEVSHI